MFIELKWRWCAISSSQCVIRSHMVRHLRKCSEGRNKIAESVIHLHINMNTRKKNMKQYLFRHISFAMFCILCCLCFAYVSWSLFSITRSFYTRWNSSNVSLCSIKINEHFMLAHVMRIFMIIIVIYAFYACMLFFSFRFVCVFIVFGMLFLLLLLLVFFFSSILLFVRMVCRSLLRVISFVCRKRVCSNGTWFLLALMRKAHRGQVKNFMHLLLQLPFDWNLNVFHCYSKSVSSEFF